MNLIKKCSLQTILFLLCLSGCSSNSDELLSTRNTSVEPKIFKNIEVWKNERPITNYQVLESNVRPDPQVDPNGQTMYPPFAAVRSFGADRAKVLGGNAIIMVSHSINQHQPIQSQQQIYSATVIKYEAITDLHKRTLLPNKVINLDVAKLVDSSNNPLEKIEIYSLTNTDESRVKDKLKLLPEFPENSYSGCHARAHYDYLELSKVTSKTYKVWLMSSALIAPAVSGNISYNSDNGERTSWDYHVALAYTDSKKTEWVIDRLLSPAPVPMVEWLENFEIEGYAVLIRGNPDNYLFNRTEVPVSSSGALSHFVPKNVFNGSFYNYTGVSLNQHWAASDIAVDALSSEFQRGNFTACEWKSLYSDSLTLKGKLSESTTPVECLQAKSLFNSEFEKWKALGL